MKSATSTGNFSLHIAQNNLEYFFGALVIPPIWFFLNKLVVFESDSLVKNWSQNPTFGKKNLT